MAWASSRSFLLSSDGCSSTGKPDVADTCAALSLSKQCGSAVCSVKWLQLAGSVHHGNCEDYSCSVICLCVCV